MGYFIKKCVICIALSQNDINSLKEKKKKISFHSLERNGKKGKKFSNMNAIHYLYSEVDWIMRLL